MSEDDTPRLDAYGHLNWTVGNEDWIACFDAMRKGDTIAYHVVVDCESGGFTDTIEAGEVPLDSASEIANLKNLPDYWADMCREHYIGSRKREHRVKMRETARTKKGWAAYLDSLMAQGPCSEKDPCRTCAECCEPGPDPIRDGWIGSDGRP